jgi:pimeloyl-ACP methyl ester carboxylesterase
MKSLFAAGLAMLQVSCAWLPRKVETPVRMLIDDGPKDARELVVLLPGRLTTPEEMDREGFTGLVRNAYPEARIVRPDLHIGYYKKRLSTERIHQDIVVPARAAGIKRVVLVGVSMGGLGAMLYDLQQPGIADELILLSPFLGEEEVIEEIEAAPSLRAWTGEPVGSRDYSRTLWKALQQRELRAGEAAPIRLGCGLDDRLAPTSRLAARELPLQGRAVWQEGGHDWSTWRALFDTMTVGE